MKKKNIKFYCHYKRGVGSLVADGKLRIVGGFVSQLTLFCFCFLALQTKCSQCCGRLHSFDYEHHHPAAISDSKVIQISLSLERKKTCNIEAKHSSSLKKEERNKQILKSLSVLGDTVKFNVHILQQVRGLFKVFIWPFSH